LDQQLIKQYSQGFLDRTKAVRYEMCLGLEKSSMCPKALIGAIAGQRRFASCMTANQFTYVCSNVQKSVGQNV